MIHHINSLKILAPAPLHKLLFHFAMSSFFFKNALQPGKTRLHHISNSYQEA